MTKTPCELLKSDLFPSGLRDAVAEMTPPKMTVHETNWCAAFASLACVVAEARIELRVGETGKCREALDKAQSIIELAVTPLVEVSKDDKDPPAP